MRFDRHTKEGFLGGVVVGLAAFGVTLLTVGAVRRMLARKNFDEPLPRFIDGVHPPTEVELDTRPPSEANAPVRRLESEMVDFQPLSQRW